MNAETIEIIFEPDEMMLRPFEAHWDQDELLAQKAIFFLKDIVKCLNIESSKVKRHARDIEAKGESPWEVMGARKIWNHWIVRMKTFAPFYREFLASSVRLIPDGWDGNRLLTESGLFYLTDVCKLVPFSAHQLRYQSRRLPEARDTLGVWKDEDVNAFLVDMSIFSKWVKKMWLT